MKDMLVYLVKSLVNNPDDVIVEEEELKDGTIEFKLTVNQDDMGRIIGRSGKTARAIRLLIGARGTVDNKRTHVAITEVNE